MYLLYIFFSNVCLWQFYLITVYMIATGVDIAIFVTITQLYTINIFLHIINILTCEICSLLCLCTYRTSVFLLTIVNIIYTFITFIYNLIVIIIIITTSTTFNASTIFVVITSAFQSTLQQFTFLL